MERINQHPPLATANEIERVVEERQQLEEPQGPPQESSKLAQEQLLSQSRQVGRVATALQQIRQAHRRDSHTGRHTRASIGRLQAYPLELSRTRGN